MLLDWKYLSKDERKRLQRSQDAREYIGSSLALLVPKEVFPLRH